MNATTILIAYTTNAGSTTDLAEEIGKELSREGLIVEVKRLEEVTDLTPYSAVVVGGPMIMGWHRQARRFLKVHQAALSQRPLALFFTAMNLTAGGQPSLDGIPFWVDPLAAKPPKNPARLSFRENYALPANYVKPVLKGAAQVMPVSVGFFGGKLAMFNLKWWQALFVMLVIQARPGGSHNLRYAREWAADLRERWTVLEKSRS